MLTHTQRWFPRLSNPIPSILHSWTYSVIIASEEWHYAFEGLACSPHNCKILSCLFLAGGREEGRGNLALEISIVYYWKWQVLWILNLPMNESTLENIFHHLASLWSSIEFTLLPAHSPSCLEVLPQKADESKISSSHLNATLDVGSPVGIGSNSCRPASRRRYPEFLPTLSVWLRFSQLLPRSGSLRMLCLGSDRGSSCQSWLQVRGISMSTDAHMSVQNLMSILATHQTFWRMLKWLAILHCLQVSSHLRNVYHVASLPKKMLTTANRGLGLQPLELSCQDGSRFTHIM